MSDLVSPVESPPVAEGNSGFHAGRIAEVKAWLSSQFDAVGKDVPEFEYTPKSVAHLHALATVSQAKTQAAGIVASDFHQKALEYRSQAARISEILDSVGLARENLPSDAVASMQDLSNVANLLNIRDTEMSSYLIAMGDITLRRAGVDEKRANLQKESKVLLDYTRRAIARLAYLKRILGQLEDEAVDCDAHMHQWQTNLTIMLSKERQYLQQYSNYKALLDRAGYTSDIRHGALVEMAEHRKELEKKSKPILDRLRSYRDLPPDLEGAAQVIKEKELEYVAAEKELEDLIDSTIATTENFRDVIDQ